MEGWAAQQQSSPEDYLILFDIDQGLNKRRKDPGLASNSLKMFVILDKRLDYRISSQPMGGRMEIRIMAAGGTIMNNTLWREFMSGRLGKLDPIVPFMVEGDQLTERYEAFKEALLRYLEG